MQRTTHFQSTPLGAAHSIIDPPFVLARFEKAFNAVPWKENMQEERSLFFETDAQSLRFPEILASFCKPCRWKDILKTVKSNVKKKYYQQFLFEVEL